jgi:hypothetical protein
MKRNKSRIEDIEEVVFPQTMLEVCQLQGDTTKDENDLYFYHGNHLSSTMMVTDINANITQAVLYPFFAGLYRLKTDFPFYHISSEQHIINAIKTDTLNVDSLIILIPPEAGWYIYDSLSNQYVNSISYVQNISDIMLLDNTEVYKIGSK